MLHTGEHSKETWEQQCEWAFLLFVFRRLDARSEVSQVGASSPWLGSASMPTLPVCHSVLCPPWGARALWGAGDVGTEKGKGQGKQAEHTE